MGVTKAQNTTTVYLGIIYILPVLLLSTDCPSNYSSNV